MSVWCKCYVLSGRGLCDELITRPKESYRLWCVVLCDLENSWMRRSWPTWGFCAKRNSIFRKFFTFYSRGAITVSILIQINPMKVWNFIFVTPVFNYALLFDLPSCTLILGSPLQYITSWRTQWKHYRYFHIYENWKENFIIAVWMLGRKPLVCKVQ